MGELWDIFCEIEIQGVSYGSVAYSGDLFLARFIIVNIL